MKTITVQNLFTRAFLHQVILRVILRVKLLADTFSIENSLYILLKLKLFEVWHEFS